MITSISPKNIALVLPLIHQYQEFYGVQDISVEKNRAFFLQFGEDSEQGCQFIFQDGENICGFATVYFSFSSTIAAKVGVLNDLFVLPEYRGKGVGKKLIEHSLSFAQNKGAARLQWLTASNNKQAQKLYDGLDTKKSEWLFYSYS